ncbi:hypothetical protein CEXT_557681 [Caerostris extrusa]|uniref:Uncharacterized protein n=1 Tax=Caerostris extrusa TaxID=172846 RepID=A0AAV4W8M3_CAEEX|nr:hypothetical protein CEXT_557681 [Caerostris extrusa]
MHGNNNNDFTPPMCLSFRQPSILTPTHQLIPKSVTDALSLKRGNTALPKLRKQSNLRNLETLDSLRGTYLPVCT